MKIIVSVQAMAQHTVETNFEGVETRFWCGCRLQKFSASLKACKFERFSDLPLSSSLSTTIDVSPSSPMLQRSSRTTQPTDDVKTPPHFHHVQSCLGSSPIMEHYLLRLSISGVPLVIGVIKSVPPIYTKTSGRGPLPSAVNTHTMSTFPDHTSKH